MLKDPTTTTDLWIIATTTDWYRSTGLDGVNAVTTIDVRLANDDVAATYAVVALVLIVANGTLVAYDVVAANAVNAVTAIVG